jgi:aspartate racemase
MSIVETCADEAARAGLQRCALIGARFIMEAPLYPHAFARRGLAIVVPDERDRIWIHDRYVNQLLKGDFRDDTRAEFVSLVRRMRETQGLDAVILGGTAALDTTGLHVAAIIERLAST